MNKTKRKTMTGTEGRNDERKEREWRRMNANKICYRLQARRERAAEEEDESREGVRTGAKAEGREKRKEAPRRLCSYFFFFFSSGGSVGARHLWHGKSKK